MTREFLEPYVDEARDRMARLEVDMHFNPNVDSKRAKELGEAYGKAWRQYNRLWLRYQYGRVIPRPQLRVPQEVTA